MQTALGDPECLHFPPLILGVVGNTMSDLYSTQRNVETEGKSLLRVMYFCFLMQSLWLVTRGSEEEGGCPKAFREEGAVEGD